MSLPEEFEDVLDRCRGMRTSAPPAGLPVVWVADELEKRIRQRVAEGAHEAVAVALLVLGELLSDGVIGPGLGVGDTSNMAALTAQALVDRSGRTAGARR